MTIFRRCSQTLYRIVLPSVVLAIGQLAYASTMSHPDQLIDVTEQFLELTVSEYLSRSAIEARHEINISRLDPRLRLNQCDQPLVASLGSTTTPIGRVTVRVSCEGSSPWSVFVPAQVRLYREVIVATRSLLRDTVLSPTDVSLAERDVSVLNQGYLTRLDEALGNKLTRPIQPDQVITPNQLEMAKVIRKGDQVVITARSGTISVRMPGEAMADGMPGKQISVKNQRSGRTIKARVIGPGQVEVAM
ncbi:flagellar basal body P-ring formation protein FlgA [Pseudomonas stutzeri]|uniref:Flagella basal body P-ring formation protein FlgA n=1 Tax=Stutzerimonas stutzeri TaxID=316 RepID=A0A2N8S2G5_STUST|nr:flagellar basal body P-ring formation chaperone FlgA [Stutzerimonas stutzeri]MCQ4296393.1 flagellar basal body P-ring formation protein FlgA [Stutzerimonas stutzeri]PNF80829.1 flagella basal body P-ring formation protein FlgA [Stutzerimonas stutzeri]